MPTKKAPKTPRPQRRFDKKLNRLESKQQRLRTNFQNKDAKIASKANKLYSKYGAPTRTEKVEMSRNQLTPTQKYVKVVRNVSSKKPQMGVAKPKMRSFEEGGAYGGGPYKSPGPKRRKLTPADFKKRPPVKKTKPRYQ
jgi:hypothetical protein